MFLFEIFVLLSVTAGCRGHELFTDTIPDDYYLRKDLSDCPDRFHKRKIFQQQCLVFGGKQADVTEFPHMAVLGWPEKAPDGGSEQVRWQCGGSLITERFVLTAGHCASDANNIPPRLVRLGDVNLASSDDDEYAQQFEIRRIVRHPDHLFSRKYFDLALVELDGAVSLTEGVCPACLWPKQTLPAGIFEAAGFGATNFGGGPIPNLLKTNLRTLDSAACTKLYKNTRGLAEGIVPDQMCAFEADADTCQGDSGGPLQVSLRSYRNTHPFVVALTSFGRGCGTGSSGVYQRVTSHIPWIESVVNATMDPVQCSEKYTKFRRWSFLIPECTPRGAYINRVRLVWPAGAKGPPIPCGGTIIDYNTVVTSARCVHNVDGIQPNAIELLESVDEAGAQIVEIQVHPEFNETSLRNDLALLRLDKYLAPDNEVAPSCIPLPKQADICTDRQTHDPVACWDQFTLNTKISLLNNVCGAQSIDRSTVKLIWLDNNEVSPCVGMLIKTDTVITSIRCMDNHSSDPPEEIELTGSDAGTRVRIARILRHPGYKKGVRQGHDTALLLLAENLTDKKHLIPMCIQEMTNEMINITHISTYGKHASDLVAGRVNLLAKRMCNESMMDSFTDLLGNSLANDSRYTCWDTEAKVIPGAVPLEPGAGLLDETHQFIRGVAAFTNGFGSVEPAISTNLSAYADWITRFVLYRPPKVELVFRAGGDEFDQGSKCRLKNGTEGNCMPDYACGRAIMADRNLDDISVCGFEGTISYVCCPTGYQDIPVINNIAKPFFDPLPPLPFENLYR